MDITVTRKAINQPALDAALREVAGGMYGGWSFNKAVAPDVYTLHFEDGTPETVIAAALQAYEEHDPTVLTPEQSVEAARIEAAAAVAEADLPGLAAEVVAAKTLEDVRPALMQALTLVGQMAVAQGLVQPDLSAPTRKGG